ncbi:unnamed protein product [Rotaria socialis]|uniref:Uncharacterized protein n=4 Tax=Rotaria socialis TaxID=392032 RepID=A0A818M2D4_9BILA|nr:unnamed protein product [Rotaria socialis]CAF3505578.1 unnamed protein product [Rotaria socialis]CAF3588250.1 unnamed protein product [Rotaria socialis]CAF4290523.1 unnamed protein product [Rotaria socialis]
MTTTTTIWELPEFYHLDNDFFRPQEKKQLKNAYENFIMNTKYKSFDYDNNLDNDDDEQILLQSKIQLFQLFVRTQPVNIRSFSLFHQQYQRVFIERLFYLVLNNVELTHFSTFNVSSIINISKELEKYQRATNKIILNTNKINTIIQFVLSFSSSSISSFQLNNLFYLLLNDMNDFSGKLIDRIAELLRVYHSITYGHTITKQYLITTIENVIRTVNFANPLVYPLYENFLNSSYVYKSPLVLILPKKTTSASLYTIIQNLSITLLGITLDDFECEDKYLSFTSEQCYHIRLIVRRLTYSFKQHRYTIEYPLNNLDKQIIVQLINLIIFQEKTYDTLKSLLDLYMKNVHGFSQTRTKKLLYDLLINSSFEFHSIETIGYFIELNHVQSNLIVSEKKNHKDDLWLNIEQIRLIIHKLYSNDIYNEIFRPFINGDCHEQCSINNLLAYLDNKLESEHEPIIDVQDIKTKLLI